MDDDAEREMTSGTEQSSGGVASKSLSSVRSKKVNVHGSLSKSKSTEQFSGDVASKSLSLVRSKKDNVHGPLQKSKSSPVRSKKDELLSTLPLASDGNSEQLVSFQDVTYCGRQPVDSPVSETEASQCMAELFPNKDDEYLVDLAVPKDSRGYLTLSDPDSEQTVYRYPVRNVLFCARGTQVHEGCVAFTVAEQSSTERGRSFVCHVLYLGTEEKVKDVLMVFGSVFRDNSLKHRQVLAETGRLDCLDHDFTVKMDFHELDNRQQFVDVPREHGVFRLQQGVVKRVIFHIEQRCKTPLVIKRCFGVLLSPGWDIDQNTMNLIDLVELRLAPNDINSYFVIAMWDPNQRQHTRFKTETPKSGHVPLSVAADVVFAGIADPVRFLMEVRIRFSKHRDRFRTSAVLPRAPAASIYHLQLRNLVTTGKPNPTEGQAHGYEVESITVTRIEENYNLTPSRAHSPLNSPSVSTTSEDSLDKEFDVVADITDSTTDDDGEPILSGTGMIDKVWSEQELEEWGVFLERWDGSGRPRFLRNNIHKQGIPEPLRGRVWELIAGSSSTSESVKSFEQLLTKESSSERVIRDDVSRTYPGHEYFRDGGEGQRALYQISKVYSIYDAEVGYCQGLSFLVAALILHLPTDRAFGVLVRIMYSYRLRELFLEGFKELSVKIYQLEKLIEDQIPELHSHFAAERIETHMFASQWFLTLYSSKFPLHTCYRILDLFFCEGQNVIFQVALALLKMAKPALIGLSFEKILTYFRVKLPKMFHSEEEADRLIQLALSSKVAERKLKKFEKEYSIKLEAEAMQSDPLDRLRTEGRDLRSSVRRLEQENDLLAQELVTSKVSLRSEMDELERKIEILTKQKNDLLSRCHRLQEERDLFEADYEQSVKEVHRQAAAVVDKLTLRQIGSCSSPDGMFDQEFKDFSAFWSRKEGKRRFRRHSVGHVDFDRHEDLVSVVQCSPPCTHRRCLQLELMECKIEVFESQQLVDDLCLKLEGKQNGT